MAASYVSLLRVFQKTLKTNEEAFGKVMKHAMSMSRHPTPEDTLCELSRSEVVCLMAITSLGMLDVAMSNNMSRAVEDWSLFPRVTAYFGGKIRVEYNIPTAFLVQAFKFAKFGNKLGFLKIPSTLVSFIKVLINEAMEEDEEPTANLPSSRHAAGPSSHKGHKSHKHQTADGTSQPSTEPSTRLSSSASTARQPTTPIARPCSPYSATPLTTPFARPSTTPTKPNPTPVRQKSAQVPEDRERATEDLWKAVKGQDARAVEAAIKAGGDKRARDELGNTPLHVAARSGSEAAVRYLLAHGAELEVKTNNGRTPLHCAAESGCVGCVSALLDAGADINGRDIRRQTPLHRAAGSGRLACTKLLVERGADLNAWTSYCDTPLTLAVWYNEPTVQQYLRSVGGFR